MSARCKYDVVDCEYYTFLSLQIVISTMNMIKPQRIRSRHEMTPLKKLRNKTIVL